MTTTTVLYLFASIGVLDTLYLVFCKMTGREVLCLFFPKEWCEKVQHSSQSKTFGVPNSLAGLVMYMMLLLFTSFWTAGSMAFWPIQTIVTIGFLFSTYFMYVQGFVLRAFCTWCVVSFINFTVMFLVIFF